MSRCKRLVRAQQLRPACAGANDQFTVSSGQTSTGITVTGITVNSSDTMTVLSGGTAVDTIVNSGGFLFDRGTTRNTAVDNRGKQAASRTCPPALSWDDACAPLCREGRALAAVRRGLVDRVSALGVLQVVADGTPIPAASVRGLVHRYLLPQGTREAPLRSTAGLLLGGVFAAGRAIPGLGARPMGGDGKERRRAFRGDARLPLPPRGPRAGHIVLEIGVLGLLGEAAASDSLSEHADSSRAA